MSKLILCHLLLLISIQALCQETNKTMNVKDDKPLFRIWDENDKNGFMDINGNIIVKPQFDEVGEFSEDLAAVRVGDKWGFINRIGETVLAPRWKNFAPRDNDGPFSMPFSYSFSEGLAAVLEKDANGIYHCGYINQKGEYVIESKIGRICGRFNDGLAAVQAGFDDTSTFGPKRFWGYIDKQGKWAISPQFFEANDFFDGFALVQTKDVEKGDPAYSTSLALIDKNGRIAKEKKDCRRRYEYSEGLAKISIGDWGEKGFQNYFVNESCEKVLTFPSDIVIVSNFSEGLAPVCRQSYDENNNLNIACGYIDRAGTQIIPLKFANAASFSEGLAMVTSGNSDSYYINRKGETVFEPMSFDPDGKRMIWSWKSPAPFKNGLAFQVLYDSPNVFGYMNKQGKYVWISPGAKKYLSAAWLKKYYIGKQNFERL